MTVIKCKMCGGDIAVNEDRTFGTCEYCGSTMTLPKVSDEQRAALFNRGNHFRRIGEFDKALAIYENIVRENDADAEAHWCCALCRFGIEYVEDPNTYEFMPTCHRASFDSFLEDVDYLAALENSDGITNRQYRKDAAKIAEVQKGILATSQNEEPFDVFICYKETDDNTKERTKDSIDAQEIYYQLTNEGYRVFFSRITLEDKAGTEYEPYIFAALNSAKVMVAIGSKPEYFNAVWVKNEWSRFLALMRKDRSKLLLPCYKGMDPYDLPEQLSVLQSYDMGKIGFIQDLIRGIKKVASKDEAPEREQAAAKSASSVEPLLKRALIFLDDEDFKSADEYAERVLDQDPENAGAYLVKLAAEFRARHPKELANCITPIDISRNYSKAMRYADEKLKGEIGSWAAAIRERILRERISEAYNEAVEKMSGAWNDEKTLRAAAEVFSSIADYEDSGSLAANCIARADEIRAERELERSRKIYDEAEGLTRKGVSEAMARAAELFASIPEYYDAEERAGKCRVLAAKLAAEEKRMRNERRRKELESELKTLDQKKELARTMINGLKGVRTLRRAEELRGVIADIDKKRAEIQNEISSLE